VKTVSGKVEGHSLA